MSVNNKLKEILFLTAVHGNEQFSIDVLKKIKEKFITDNYSYLIANEEALKKNVRYIDADLNRVAPGQKNSKKYEYSRAYELLKECKKYHYVIDIHGTLAKTGIFTIITNPKLKNIKLANSLPINNIVVWGEKAKKGGPLTRFVDCGLEIECGPKNSVKIKKQLSKVIKIIINQKINFNSKLKSKKNLFKVYGKLLKSDLPKNYKLKEFKKVKIGRESFYPLLINRYNDIICYKMKKVVH